MDIAVRPAPAISMNIRQAAEATGVSVEIIRRAIEKGDLVPRYPSARPVLMTEEVRDWVDSRPTERP